MVKIYCEDGSMTKEIKQLKKNSFIQLISFPFENYNRRTHNSKKPSELTCDTTLTFASSTMKIGDTGGSEIFCQIKDIIGKENFNDIRHVDTAYKEKCQLFISPDKKDIINKRERLFKLTGIKFFYCEDIEEIRNYIKTLHPTN